jgi:hypothetical protein
VTISTAWSIAPLEREGETELWASSIRLLYSTVKVKITERLTRKNFINLIVSFLEGIIFNYGNLLTKIGRYGK